MKYSIRTLLVLTTVVACWTALALQLRALAILILPIGIGLASVLAIWFSGKNQYVRRIFAFVAMLSLIASYVAFLGPFYFISTDWNTPELSSLGTSICLLFDPLMDVLPRHAPKLWALIYNQYLLEWIE